jgi:hypothetical protein
MRYILEVSEPGQPDALVAQLSAKADEVKEEIVTAAEQLIERGRHQEDREILLDLLQGRFGAVPEAAAAKVAAAGSQQLRAWIRRLLTAKALDEVLAD